MEGMDPEMMKLAMEQMKNLTPEQMEEMKKQVAEMSPEAIEEAMNVVKNSNPEEIKEQMKGAPLPEDPAEMRRQMEAYTQHQKDSHDYKYNASMQLKAEGNKFFTAGQYEEAKEKYTRAKKNLNGLSSLAARKLHRTCMLNEAACCLSLEMWEECARLTTAIVKNAESDPQNVLTAGQGLKTYYRKGQALHHLGRYSEAYQDLMSAHGIAPQDEGVKAALKLAKEALAKENEQGGEVKTEAKAEPVVEEVDEDCPPPEEVDEDCPPLEEVDEDCPPLEEVDEDCPPLEEVDEDCPPLEEVDEDCPPLEEVQEMPRPRNSNWTPEQEHRLQTDPEYAAKVQEQLRAKMEAMTDEQLMEIGKRMPGMPPGMFNADMVRAATEAMINMSPEELMEYKKAQTQMNQMSHAPGGMPSTSDIEKMDKLFSQNPNMMKQATEMMGNMTEEDLKEMAKMSGMPEEQFNPEMMKAAADAMSKMTPEDLQNMTKLAQQTENMESSSKIEKIAKATEVLSEMSTESFMGVSKQMGYEMSEKQARMMTTFARFVSVLLKMLAAIVNFIVTRWYVVLAFIVVVLGWYMQK
ncbi:tetratricopeptide repeat domain-containing protein [Chloropicon primus]|uniref:Tetratricopeptide repeat domain-containing protein n=1 Tax=Chloropicon primus TaxID=1764295 RepID=A0A5B8MDU9_9CHLO|nr:tetratricopeptide repeat domain-containing protein [Chloropicon primus]UPQ97555.1 tetratricopeptide repeat domain-containing protein [Chloropicon primus]|eukprot:QDZ18344.1 tetratricopeptide repeat domain-containing protein [Chloropicon primus]